MSINLTMRDFEDINLYSNANIERLARSVINKSSNAALVSMYEDQVILLDHNSGAFYTADYKFDKEKATFVFENFEEVQIEPDESNFKQKVYEFFDDDEASILELSESYKDEILSKDRFVKELVNESLALKDFSDLVNYEELRVMKEEVSIKDEKFFQFYKERLNTHPLNEAKLFDWENPVIVSLIDTEPRKLITKTVTEKTHDLWKVKAFKERFNEAANTLLEEYEEGVEMFSELFEEYSGIYLLDNADRKSLFGKIIIGNSGLRESLDLLQKGLKDLFETNENFVSERNRLLSEAGHEEGEEEEGEEEVMEVSPEEMKKIGNELNRIADKVEDEKLREKIAGIASKLGASIEEGTRPTEIKEAISILNILL